jgi:hypothetical protein
MSRPGDGPAGAAPRRRLRAVDATGRSLEELSKDERRALWPKARTLTDRHLRNCRLVESRERLLEFMPRGGRCAEIGIDQGDFSAAILAATMPAKLHLIDVEAAFVDRARALRRRDRRRPGRDPSRRLGDAGRGLPRRVARLGLHRRRSPLRRRPARPRGRPPQDRRRRPDRARRLRLLRAVELLEIRGGRGGQGNSE